MNDLDKIHAGLVRNRMAQIALASIAGFSAPRLSRILKGQEPLHPVDAALLLNTLEEIDRLAREVAPQVPIDFSQSLIIREILEKRLRSKVFVVKFAGGQFAGLDVHSRPVARDRGMVLGGEAAHRVCEELRCLRYDGVRAERVESDVEPINDFVLAWRQQPA